VLCAAAELLNKCQDYIGLPLLRHHCDGLFPQKEVTLCLVFAVGWGGGVQTMLKGYNSGYKLRMLEIG
jgi:hypothetical protein